MDLPNLFTANDSGSAKLILCVVLSDASVQSLLLSVSLQGTKVLKKSSVIPYTDKKTCVIKTDESLQELGKESEEVNEVLFGLEQAWLDGNAIAENKKDLLHAITTELSLKPIGFVVQTEALYQYHLSQNSHLSAILLVFSEHYLSVLVIAQGKLQLTETVGRSADVVADIKEALARYSQKYENTYLPGKLICASFVLSDTELSQYQQQLLDVTWGEEFSFVQNPSVDSMRSDLAISLIAQQAGQAVAAMVTDSSPAADKKEEMPAATPISTAETEQGESMGFHAVNKDELAQVDENSEKAIEVEEQPTASSFGIPIKSAPVEEKAIEEPTATATTDPDDEDDDFSQTEQPFWKKLFSSRTATGAQKKYNPKLFIIGGISAGLLTLVAAAFVFIFFFSEVKAVIIPRSQIVSKEITLTIDPEAQAPDPQNAIIPGELVTKALSAQESIQTTGVKIVGDKATGTALIYNKTESDKKFAEGTVLEAGEVQFVTTEEVTVPAAEVEEKQGGSNTDYGEATVPVEAYLIGVEGNIGKETEMTVADFATNTYSALAENDFDGGSSREIRVVAEEDLAAVRTKVTETLLAKATEEFEQESGNGVYLLPTNTIELTSGTYSAEVEQEADEIAISAEGTVSALSYKTEDLKPLALAILSAEVPSGYQIADQEPEILSQPAETVDDQNEVALDANLSVVALPTFNHEVIKQDIAGKPVAEALSNLQSREGVKSASFTFYPSWASGLVSAIPGKLERISIEVVEE